MALPTSYARRLASASQPVIITDKKKVDDDGLFAWLGALTIASLVGVLLICNASAAATRGHHAATSHAPKTLQIARAAERHAGHHTPVVKAAKPVTHTRHRSHPR